MFKQAFGIRSRKYIHYYSFVNILVDKKILKKNISYFTTINCVLCLESQGLIKYNINVEV